MNLSHFRFWLELIALPFFVFLVIHLSGHGAMLLTDPNHSNELHDEHEEEGGEHDEHHDETEEEHNNHAQEDSDLHEKHSEHAQEFISQELIFGILFLLVFVWIWHRPTLKKWIPCQHEHCHEKNNWLHIAAIIAFCLHFFPEAAIRHQLLHDFSWESFTSLASAIGFLSHFFIDIIVAITLSLSFMSRFARTVSLIIIFGLYALSFLLEENIFEFIPAIGEGILLLVSAFLLSMFVHMPHKPKQCVSCE